MKTSVGQTGSLVYGIDQIAHVAGRLYELKENCSVYAFTGSLGAGKTTLVQALLQRFGVTGIIMSPTFTYVNVYYNADKQSLYHFDLYRLHTVDDFVAAGFEEYLYQPASWSFIEWPEVIQPLLKDRVCHVSIDYEGLEHRRVTYTISVGA